MSYSPAINLLKSAGIGAPELFFGGLMMNDFQVREFVKGSYVNTYDLPKIEFMGPQTVFDRDLTMGNYSQMVNL